MEVIYPAHNVCSDQSISSGGELWESKERDGASLGMHARGHELVDKLAVALRTDRVTALRVYILRAYGVLTICVCLVDRR